MRGQNQWRPGFILSLVVATLYGYGVFLALLGLVIYFRGWSNLVDRALMTAQTERSDDDNDYSNDHDDVYSPKPIRKRVLILYGLIVAVELVILSMFLKLVVPWVYTRYMVALKIDQGNNPIYVLHGSIWLIAGVFVYAAVQGFLVFQEYIMTEPYQEEITISIVLDQDGDDSRIHHLVRMEDNDSDDYDESMSEDEDTGSESSYDDDVFTDMENFSYDDDEDDDE